MILKDNNFNSEVIESEIPVLVDFWASWCPPCKMIEPVVEKLAARFVDKVKIATMNVDQNQVAAARYSVNGVPTFIAFANGDEIERKVGAQTEATLVEMINTALQAHNRNDTNS
ncbi:MAG: thioredoxin [Chitinivibrionales bacterium]|nr:thioredoxin [Chitinivibrionales bacterium]